MWILIRKRALSEVVRYFPLKLIVTVWHKSITFRLIKLTQVSFRAAVYKRELCSLIRCSILGDFTIFGHNRTFKGMEATEKNIDTTLKYCRLLPTAYVVRDGRLYFHFVCQFTPRGYPARSKWGGGRVPHPVLSRGGGGPPRYRTTNGVLDTPRSVCLLRSRRRSFLVFLCVFSDVLCAVV